MRLTRHNSLVFLQGLTIAYALICLSVWAFQRQLLYFPHTNIQPPEAYGLHDFADVRLRSADATALQAWYRPAKPDAPTLIYFHGNAGHLGGRAGFFRLVSEAGFGVLALSYRGYGHSQGSPSEQGFYMDARAVMQHALKNLSLKPEQLILYGESIGAGVAVQMATEYAAGALILQSPFSSISDIAKSHYPWLPVNQLLADKFDSIGKISRINMPLLVLHGEIDVIVPVESGKLLFDRASQPKDIFYFPKTGHNDFDLNQINLILVRFLPRRK